MVSPPISCRRCLSPPGCGCESAGHRVPLGFEESRPDRESGRLFSFGADSSRPCPPIAPRPPARGWEAFWAGPSRCKKNKSSAVLWHLYQRRLQAGDAAVVLTASALPALPRRSRLACYLKLLAWSATATGSPARTAGHPARSGRAAKKLNRVSYSGIPPNKPDKTASR